MKWLGLLLVFLIGGGMVFFSGNKTEMKNQKITASPTTAVVKASKTEKEIKVLFVPYWSLTQQEIPQTYGDTFAYFGIAVNNNGIDTKEAGYQGLERFVSITPQGVEKLLTLRMLAKETNTLVLQDKKLQEKVIQETIRIAKQYGFSGIVLDLEFSSLPFAKITDQITSFTKDISKETKKENLTFSMLIYGDTFYRFRPYDVIALVPYTDKLYVMAYDFHKAKKDPGPNFPFLGKETYGYDFTVMVTDFLNIVPKEKLGIVFGMFGYDWVVDVNGKGTKQAKAVTLYEAKEKFLEKCVLQNCNVKREEKSQETVVTYTDKEGNNHAVWFEDEDSVSVKQNFLREKGINTVGYWAYSYF